MKSKSIIILFIFQSLLFNQVIGEGLYLDDLLTYLLGESSESTLRHVLEYFMGGASAIISVVLTPWLIMLVGFPLCEPLAAAIDQSLGGEEIEIGFLESMVTGIRNSIGLIVLGLSVSILLMLASLIPGVSLITVPFNLFIWTPMILVFDLCDSIFVRRNWGFKQRKDAILGDFFGSVSIGLIALVLIAVPVLNLIGLPVAVCMGTLHARKLAGDS